MADGLSLTTTCVSLGVEHGRAKGDEAGEAAGYDKGHELGRELGEYRGRVATLTAFILMQQDVVPER